jgi:hypothetical protein
VGTAGGGYGFTDPGGFAGDGRAGIVADVSNNTFGGNFGVDVYIQSFVSTIDPPVTQGTWTDTEFDVTQFEGDPLARLDLVFQNNTGDAAIVNPSFIQSNDTRAAYNNDEGTFKSRTDDQTDPGPFTSGTRRRNAQRLASRSGFAAPGTPAASNAFLYPGVGDSTFRVDGDTLGFTFSDGFLGGAPMSPNVEVGELDYGWGVLP